MFQPVQERSPIIMGEEDRLPVIPPLNHVVEPTCHIHALPSCHPLPQLIMNA
jgi:hypothetical protein